MSLLARPTTFCEGVDPTIIPYLKVEEVLSTPYLSREQELGHAVERRSQYVPLFVRRQRNKWLKKEQSLFPSLMKNKEL